MLSEVKKDLRVQNSTLILGGRGWGRQGKGISISTMQKGAILWKCVNTFVPHCSFSLPKWQAVKMISLHRVQTVKFTGYRLIRRTLHGVNVNLVVSSTG